MNSKIPEDDKPIIDKFLKLTERNKIKVEGVIDNYLKEQRASSGVNMFEIAEELGGMAELEAEFIKNNATVKAMGS